MIKVNIDKAKIIAHDLRRQKREKEFAPWDEIIAKAIPGDNVANAEVERTKIRKKYAKVQADIDAAADEETLRSILTGNEIV